MLWGSHHTDSNVNKLKRLLTVSVWCVLTMGKAQDKMVSATQSVIDLTFLSSTPAGSSSWKVLKKTTIGIDHYPVLTNIGSQVCHEKIKVVPGWKIQTGKFSNVMQ